MGNLLNSRLKTIATTSLLALTLSLGMSACTGTDQGGSNPAPSASSAQVDLKTQAEAKKTVDAFFKQVSVDLPEYEKGLAGKKTDAEQDAAFDEAFKKSSEFLKPGSFTPEQTKTVIGSFAQLYIYDKEAKIESDESKFELSGETAVIKGTDFTLTLGGKVQEQQADPEGKAGRMTLTFEDDKWLISGFDTGEQA
jgi:hypothetical protein